MRDAVRTKRQAPVSTAPRTAGACVYISRYLLYILIVNEFLKYKAVHGHRNPAVCYLALRRLRKLVRELRQAASHGPAGTLRDSRLLSHRGPHVTLSELLFYLYLPGRFDTATVHKIPHDISIMHYIHDIIYQFAYVAYHYSLVSAVRTLLDKRISHSLFCA